MCSVSKSIPFLSLSFSSFSHFTHLQQDELLTLNCHGNVLLARSQTPSFQNSFPSGVVSGHQLTYLPNSIFTCRSKIQQKERQWQRAYQRRPTPLEAQEKKRQRQKHAHHWQQFTRARFQAVDSRQNSDANQSN